VTDLLIRDIDPQLKSQLEDAARKNHQNLSETAKVLIRRGLNAPEPGGGLGTKMFNMILPEDRGDDLVFEVPSLPSRPPDFE
jgi:hypothetical protein